jgi:hypothetical protein
MSTQYRFEFEDRYRLPARIFGVTEQSAVVTVDATEVEARFGRWTVRTPLTNVASVAITGPYAFVKTAGPPHLSFSDRASPSRRTPGVGCAWRSVGRSAASSRPACSSTRTSP